MILIHGKIRRLLTLLQHMTCSSLISWLICQLGGHTIGPSWLERLRCSFWLVHKLSTLMDVQQRHIASAIHASDPLVRGKLLLTRSFAVCCSMISASLYLHVIKSCCKRVIRFLGFYHIPAFNACIYLWRTYWSLALSNCMACLPTWCLALHS